MSPRRHLLLLLLALAGAIAADAAAPDRYDTTTKARIEALLNRHHKATPLPAKPANPFFFASGNPTPPIGPATPTTEKAPLPEPTAAALSDDDQILAFCVARLRITGQVLRNGVAHLLINANTYREGDLIPVRGAGETVYYVRIVRVAPNEVVFGYNDSVLTLPLKG